MSKKSKSNANLNPNAPPPPKRPLTAFFRFVADNREPFRKKYPEEVEKRIISLLGEAWKNTTDKDKKKYEEAYQDDKIRYDEEFQEYTRKYGSAKQKKRRGIVDDKDVKKVKNSKGY